MTVWGVHGTGRQSTNNSSFPFRTFLEHYPLFPGSGVSDRLVRSAWYSFTEGILACILSVFLLLPSDLCVSLLWFFYMINQLFLWVEDTGLSLGERYPVTIPHSRVGHWWPIQLYTINPEQSCLSSTYVYFLYYFLFGCWLRSREWLRYIYPIYEIRLNIELVAETRLILLWDKLTSA